MGRHRNVGKITDATTDSARVIYGDHAADLPEGTRRRLEHLAAILRSNLLDEVEKASAVGWLRIIRQEFLWILRELQRTAATGNAAEMHRIVDGLAAVGTVKDFVRDAKAPLDGAILTALALYGNPEAKTIPCMPADLRHWIHKQLPDVLARNDRPKLRKALVRTGVTCTGRPTTPKARGR